MLNKRSILAILFIILFISFFLFRIINIGADPPLSVSWSIGPWLDSNFYLKNIHNKIVTGHFILSKDADNQIYSNPVYVFLAYAVVKVFGMGYTQLTFLSLISSIITLGILFFWIRELYDEKTAYLSVALFGFNYFYIMYNKLVLVETPAIMFIVLSLFLFSMGRKHIAFSLLSGIAATCAFFCRSFSVMFLSAVFLTYLLYCIGGRCKGAIKRQFKYFLIGTLLTFLAWFLFFALPNWENIIFHYRSRFGMASGAFLYPAETSNITHKAWFMLSPLVVNMPVLLAVCGIFLLVVFSRCRSIIKRVRTEEVIMFLYLLIYSVFLFFLYRHNPPRRLLYYVPFICIYSSFAIVKGFEIFNNRKYVKIFKNIFIVFLLALHFYSQIHSYMLWHFNRRYDVSDSCKLIASYLKPSDIVFGETNFIWSSRCRFIDITNANLGGIRPSLISSDPFGNNQITHIMLKIPHKTDVLEYLTYRLKSNEIKNLIPLCEAGVKNVKYRLYKMVY